MGVWLGPMGSSEFYKYTGTSEFSQSGNNWEIKLLSSGNFKFNKDPGEIDIFLVGAGAPGTGGNSYNIGSYYKATGGTGGRGGECKTIPLALIQKRIFYKVVIGENGSNTLFGNNYSALGGNANWSSQTEDPRKQGGSSGISDGYNNGTTGGGTTYAGAGSNGYYAFNENIGERYGASGAGGGASVQRSYSGGDIIWATAQGANGGTNGGGQGGQVNDGNALNGSNATFYGAGGGGGGAGTYTSSTTGGNGGNGIIIIRNHRSS